MIHSYDYNSNYLPAMPVVDVVLENYETGENGEQFTAIIDSGADAVSFRIVYSMLSLVNPFAEQT